MNAITLAFIRTRFPGKFEGQIIKEAVRQNTKGRNGSWNCKLSYRTHQALVADGYSKFSG